MMEQRIKGITYITIPEESKGACTGCVAYKDSNLCAKLAVNSCGTFIWKKSDVQLVTLEQVKAAIHSFIPNEAAANGLYENIKKALDKVRDPEYDTYLKLKEKFKD